MITTPIVDFLNKYSERDVARFHMPGHKGMMNAHDITEICGADDLYHADGIIAESEANATKLFDTRRTFYSTEGSSLCIRAMLYVAMRKKKALQNALTDEGDKEQEEPSGKKERLYIVAGRNAHKTLILTAALLDFDIEWLYSEDESTSLLECWISPEGLKNRLQELKEAKGLPFAVFVTSPNYLGQVADVGGLAKVAHSFGIPLLVDNAHGAYLKFLEGEFHPMELGADMCCDSAHKTLPALTGTAYLHVGKQAINSYEDQVKQAMALFGSTSPSYLLMESLDKVNATLEYEFAESLVECIGFVSNIKEVLTENGFVIEYSEPLKIVINAKKSGVSGSELVSYLREKGIEPEYADDDFIVLMASPYNKVSDFEKLSSLYVDDILFLKGEPAKEKENIWAKMAEKKTEQNISNLSSADKLCNDAGCPIVKRVRQISIREALFAESEEIPVEQALGRICASPTVSCPPAIPIVVAGEVIEEKDIKLLEYYGHSTVVVVS